LGLPVSRKLARLMGGDVQYSYEDNRSCFLLFLPLG
jgi:signal transduction histidine kinase